MFNQYKYNNDYTRDNYARLSVLVPKGAKDAILAHIESKGYGSTSEYFKSLLARDMGLTDLSELVGGGAKMIKKIWRFMYMHPIITMIIGCLITGFIEFTKSGNRYTGMITFILIYGMLSPILKSARRKEIKKQEADYLAKKIAEESANIANEKEG